MNETRVPTPEEAARQRLALRATTLATVLSLVEVPQGPACAVVYAGPEEKFCLLRGRIVPPRQLPHNQNGQLPDAETMDLYHWFVDESLGERDPLKFRLVDCGLEGDGPGWLLHVRDRAIAQQAMEVLRG